jgi:glycosyltransferase involved in cell wall biosynthesis
MAALKDAKPRLVIDARVVDAGGLGRYFRNVVSGVLASDRFETVLMGSPAALRKYPWSARASLAEFPYPLFSAGEQMGFRSRIPACDIFWSPHYNVPFLPVRARKRLTTVHDCLHYFMYRDLSIPQKAYVQLAMNLGARQSDAIITVSEFSKNEIARYVRFPPRRVEVIPNAIETGFAELPDPGPAPADPYLLYVGNVKPHKNLKGALRGFARLGQAHARVRFLIAGKKDVFKINDREIDEIVAGFPPGRVEFLGEVGEGQLKRLYRWASAFVYPSLYEGFGLPILEAMAFGIPVIASGGSSIPEVGGDAIEYFDPRDAESIRGAMERVLAPGFRPDPAAYARQSARFSLAECVARHIEVLSSL